MPHPTDRRPHARQISHALARPGRHYDPPGGTAVSRVRVLTAQGREALDEAAATTDLVHEARRQVLDLADRRRRAVLAANDGGASYRVIAQALGISGAGVQQLMIAARAASPEPRTTTAGGDR